MKENKINIEHYNKTYTSQKLEELFDRFLSDDNSQEITLKNIDNLLQSGSDWLSYTQDSCFDYLVRFYQEGLLLPELFTEDGNAWRDGNTHTQMDILQKEYQTGNYFHICFNEYVEADEWLAINFKSQRTAARFLSALLNETGDDGMPMKERLFSARFYAAKGESKFSVNHEKVVLYYPEEYSKNIYNFVMKKLEGYTLPYLNPFCTLYSLQNKTLCFGTGHDRGTYSFQQQCALYVAEFINGAPVNDWEDTVSLEKVKRYFLKRKQDFVTDCFTYVCNRLRNDNLHLNNYIINLILKPMKMTKHLCVMLAAAGLFACSNEDVINEPAAVAVSGPAALTIQINNPGMSRATTTGTTGDDGQTAAITVNNLIVKYLPSGTYAKLDNLTLTNGQDQTLYDVPEGTTGFVVVGNSLASSAGEAAFSSTSDAETNDKTDKSAAAATVYGMTNELTATGEVISGDGTENGGQANTSYSKYTAKVTVSPVTARMEVSGLKFVPKESGSAFSSLTLEGVFLNDYYKAATFSTSAPEAVTPKKEQGNILSIVDSPESVDALKTALGGEDALADWLSTENNFYTNGSTPEAFPKNNEVWAYNFFVDADNAEHSLPKFTVVLKPTYAKSAGEGYGDILYAVITKYQTKVSEGEPTEITKFEAGKIYQITSLELPEDVLTPDINGNQTIAITATVTVVPWTIQQTTGVWEGQN